MAMAGQLQTGHGAHLELLTVLGQRVFTANRDGRLYAVALRVWGRVADTAIRWSGHLEQRGFVSECPEAAIRQRVHLEPCGSSSSLQLSVRLSDSPSFKRPSNSDNI